jgi:hypothetical protein
MLNIWYDGLAMVVNGGVRVQDPWEGGGGGGCLAIISEHTVLHISLHLFYPAMQ